MPPRSQESQESERCHMSPEGCGQHCAVVVVTGTTPRPPATRASALDTPREDEETMGPTSQDARQPFQDARFR